jgi:hypothetical protein
LEPIEKSPPPFFAAVFFTRRVPQRVRTELVNDAVTEIAPPQPAVSIWADGIFSELVSASSGLETFGRELKLATLALLVFKSAMRASEWFKGLVMLRTTAVTELFRKVTCVMLTSDESMLNAPPKPPKATLFSNTTLSIFTRARSDEF